MPSGNLHNRGRYEEHRHVKRLYRVADWSVCTCNTGCYGGWALSELEIPAFYCHVCECSGQKSREATSKEAPGAVPDIPAERCEGKARKQSFFSFTLCTLSVNKLHYVRVASSCICFSPHRQNLHDYEL